MKVFIHALGADVGGALRHLTNFLPELGKVDPNNEYTVLLRESLPKISTSENIVFQRIQDKKGFSWKKRMLGDLIQLPINLKKENYDVLVSLTNFGPIWTPIPHILFQRSPLFYCRHYLNNIKGKLKFETFMRQRWAVESMKRADIIVTPSKAMGEMIRKTCPSVQNRNFKTIYHGFIKDSLDGNFQNDSTSLNNHRGLKLLYPTHAGIGPYKGFEILFDSLSILKSKNLEFTLFTSIPYRDMNEGIPRYEKQLKSLNLEKNVVFLGRIPQDQMGRLYEQCDLMVYPSLCESFGFSMIEAMGFGLPIVAAGTDLNREICQDAALYYEALDPEDGAKCISNAFQPKMLEKLQKKGQERYHSYDWSWKRCAEEFVQLLTTMGI